LLDDFNTKIAFLRNCKNYTLILRVAYAVGNVIFAAILMGLCRINPVITCMKPKKVFKKIAWAFCHTIEKIVLKR
jgi:hypothetical protein